MIGVVVALVASCLVGLASSRALDSRRPHGHHNHCPPFNNGTFNIHQYQLYPDNAAFDTDNCVLYIRYLTQVPASPVPRSPKY